YHQLSLRLTAARFAYVNARRTQIERARERMLVLDARARLAISAILDNRFARIERAERLLAAVSYRGVLARGFALVRDPTGKPLRTTAAVQRGMRLDIEFSDGRGRATAEASALAPLPPPKPRRRRGGGGEGQGDLVRAWPFPGGAGSPGSACR